MRAIPIIRSRAGLQPVESKKVTLVILPGLDGLVTLLESFIASMRASFDVIDAISYPPDASLSYVQLEDFVRAALPPEKPFVLLAQSFSGPIALAIAVAPLKNLIGLVLSTTVAMNPMP